LIPLATAPAAGARRELLATLLLRRHRRGFTVLDRRTYLNFGTQGPLPAAALAALDAVHAELDREGPASAEGAAAVALAARGARAALAAELAVPAPALALVESTTVGCNVALWGIDWRPGDHLIVGDHEYPGIAAAAVAVAARFSVELTRWPVDGPPPAVLAALAARLRPRTRAVVASHVGWDTGRILPLPEVAALCRDHGGGATRLVIDGAQAAGVLPLDLPALGADVYACPGHKWWCGPAGTGALYVAPAALAAIRPVFVGARGLPPAGEGAGDGLLADARRFEVSTAALPLYAGLTAALAVHHEWGTAAGRLARIQQLGRRLWDGLGALPAARLKRLQAEPPEAGLVFFRLPAADPEAAARALEAQGILVRAIAGAGCLRASLHYLNLDEEIDRLLAALDALRPAGG
jgi:L-cysteine/cystine lyase